MATPKDEERQVVVFWDTDKNVIPDGGSKVIGRMDFQALGTVRHSSRISRLHTTLCHVGGRLWVIDLGSENGTWIGGLRLIPGVLHPVDLASSNPIQLGRVPGATIGIKKLNYVLPAGFGAELLKQGGMPETVFWLTLGGDNDPIQIEIKVEAPPQPPAAQPGPFTSAERTVSDPFQEGVGPAADSRIG